MNYTILLWGYLGISWGYTLIRMIIDWKNYRKLNTSLMNVIFSCLVVTILSPLWIWAEAIFGSFNNGEKK